MVTSLAACSEKAGESESAPSAAQISGAETESASSGSLPAESAAESAAEDVKDDGTHTLYFRDCTKSSKIVATFFNSASGETADVEMEKQNEDGDAAVFSCEGDTSAYNMAYVTADDKQTFKFAFNKCVSGWCRTEDDFFPYTQGEDVSFTPEFDNVTLTGYGYDKPIHIWKPEGYDASSGEKYSTIYVLDGQNAADFGRADYSPDSCPGIVEQVRAMSAVTGEKAIVVAIENILARDYELVPDIEMTAEEREAVCGDGLNAKEPASDESDYDGMSGVQFADFIANKLVPYVREHYNVYTDASHTALQGASLGGLESFYIVNEYPGVFGTLGSFSPSFYEFDDDAWREYLGEKSFGDDSPFIYLYTGPSGNDTDPFVTEMYERLKDMGYPEEKLAFHFNAEGTHSSLWWRSVFSEFLTAMVFSEIAPLEQ